MTRYIVTGVRRERAADGAHDHVVDIFTQGAIRHSVSEVLSGLAAGDSWWVIRHGFRGELQALESCPHPNCTVKPYLATNPHGADTGTLEELGPC